MKLSENIILGSDDKNALLKMWNTEYPTTLHYEIHTFEDYLESLQDAHHYILKDDDGNMQAWACKFTRDCAKWFALIVDGKLHGTGLGTTLLNVLKKNEKELNAWVIDKNTFTKENGEVYRSPIAFYLKNSFHLMPENRIDTEKLSAVKIIWGN